MTAEFGNRMKPKIVQLRRRWDGFGEFPPIENQNVENQITIVENWPNIYNNHPRTRMEIFLTSSLLVVR